MIAPQPRNDWAWIARRGRPTLANRAKIANRGGSSIDQTEPSCPQVPWLAPIFGGCRRSLGRGVGGYFLKLGSRNQVHNLLAAHRVRAGPSSPIAVSGRRGLHRNLCERTSNKGHRNRWPLLLGLLWSGRPDLNWGLPTPHAGALPGCATPRWS